MLEALGLSEDEVHVTEQKVDVGEWHLPEIVSAPSVRLADRTELDSGPSTMNCLQNVAHRFGDALRPASSSGTDSILEYLKAAHGARFHDPAHDVPHAAVPARLRKPDRGAAQPRLPVPCDLCEAEFLNRTAFEQHVSLVHGGSQHYEGSWYYLERCRPHVTNSPIRLCLWGSNFFE